MRRSDFDAWLRITLPRPLYVLTLVARHPCLIAIGLGVLLTGEWRQFRQRAAMRLKQKLGVA